MRRKILIFLLGVTMCLLFQTCNSPNSTAPPETPESKYFHVQVQYTRTQIRQSNPDWLDAVWVDVYGRCNWGYCSFGWLLGEMIDDYHFAWSALEVIPDNEDGPLYSMIGTDRARWDGVHDDTMIVGEIFRVRVQETGFEKQLTNVVQADIPGLANNGPNARMVLFRLKKDGTVIDN